MNHETQTKISRLIEVWKKDKSNFRLAKTILRLAVEENDIDIGIDFYSGLSIQLKCDDQLRNQRGIMALEKRDFGYASVIFDEIHEKHPNDLNIKYNLALSLIGLGDIESAIKTIHPVIKQGYQLPRILLLLSELHVLADDFENALTALEHYMSTCQEDKESEGLLCILNYKTGRKTAARRLSIKLINSENPPFGACITQLVVDMETKNYTSAKLTIDAIFDKFPHAGNSFLNQVRDKYRVFPTDRKESTAIKILNQNVKYDEILFEPQYIAKYAFPKQFH